MMVNIFLPLNPTIITLYLSGLQIDWLQNPEVLLGLCVCVCVCLFAGPFHVDGKWVMLFG